MEIMDYQPTGQPARPWQVGPLKAVEKDWDRYDIFILPGRVGFGKSHHGMTISNWRAAHGESTALVTPRVALQDQYLKSYPNIPVLKGKNRYLCNTHKISCGAVYELDEGYCTGCHYKALRERVRESQQAVFNYSSYLFLRQPRDVLVFDEAHLIYDFLADQFTLKLWRHQESYPDDVQTSGDLAVWLESRVKDLDSEIAFFRNLGEYEDASKLKKRQLKFIRIRMGLETAPANFFIEKGEEEFRGSVKEVLRVRPNTLLGLPEILWPRKTTKKMILMSGTISPVDLRRLGLQGYRIKWLRCENPIPADRRPVDCSWGVNMSYKYQDKNIPKLATKLEELAAKYETKGIVHATYAIAEKLKTYLPENDRFMWHNKDNKDAQLEAFFGSENGILIACGLGEGLDLVGPEYGWQAITKVMWPNKSDKLVDKWYREDIEWIKWLTIRMILQQTGRITRGPDDYGITHILDSAFGNLAKRRRGLIQQCPDMVPGDYLESIRWG